jgi:hypothetical protein
LCGFARQLAEKASSIFLGQKFTAAFLEDKYHVYFGS